MRLKIMSLIKLLSFFSIFLGLNQAKVVLATENQQYCEVDLTKSVPMYGVKNIQFKIDTSIKQELSKLIKKEFAHQQEELTLERKEIIHQREEFAEQQKKMNQLIEMMDAQKANFSKIENELIEQNVLMKNTIINELAAQLDKFQTYMKNELDTVCRKVYLAENRQLSEIISKNFSNQAKIQEKLVENAFKAVQTVPRDSSQWNDDFNCTKNCGPIMDLPGSCEDAMKSNFSKDGVYLLNVKDSGLKPFFVYCKRIDNKPWTIMQRREDGSVNFYRNWTEYKNGFGNLYGELWLGLERLHVITTKHKHKLRVWLENKSGRSVYAQYERFAITNETDQYKLIVDGHSGSACDRLTIQHNGTGFSTYDRNNDNMNDTYDSCAKHFKGAWWFGSCYISHLNAPYNATTEEGIDWTDFDKKLKLTEMAISRG